MSPIVCYGLAVYLIGSFLWRVLIPAHEYPGSTATWLGIAVDVLAIVDWSASELEFRRRCSGSLWSPARAAGRPSEQHGELVDRAPDVFGPLVPTIAETSLCLGRIDTPAGLEAIGHMEWAGSAARIERQVELSVLVVFADNFSRTIRLQRLQIDGE